MPDVSAQRAVLNTLPFHRAASTSPNYSAAPLNQFAPRPTAPLTQTPTNPRTASAAGNPTPHLAGTRHNPQNALEPKFGWLVCSEVTIADQKRDRCIL